MYQPISKPATNKVASKGGESSKGAVLNEQSTNVPIVANMNDSSQVTNEYGYFMDEINIGELKRDMEKLIEVDKVLDIHDQNKVDVNATTNVVSNFPIQVSKEGGTENVNSFVLIMSNTENLWEQLSKTRGASTSKDVSSLSVADESDDNEVYMPEVVPGGGFLDDMEDDLDNYDGYETQVYDLPDNV